MTARPGERGFTLIELLIALAVLGLLLSLLGGAMRMGLAWMTEGEARAQSLLRVASAQALLRRTLAGIVPAPASGRGEETSLLFEGNVSRLSFAGRLPEHAPMPGLAWIILARLGGDRSGALTVSWQSLDRPKAGVSYAPQAGSLTLLDGTAALEIRYLVQPDNRAEPVWVEEWVGMARLPLAIRIDMTPMPDAGWSWPSLVVRPMLD